MNPLPLFPTAGFDHSVTTPVLLGVLVSWLFCETFGWVFAGLVVPGYLAAVFAIDPRAGFVDVAEAIFTYAIARGLGEHLPRTGLTSRVFGRERFLLIVLVSIVVRLGVEGALLPRLAPHAANSFFSIGLVVVPLAANACWKTGLARGIVQNGVPTLIVFLLLKFLLVPHTNLSLYGFQLATEDVAASFLSSPKAYIILITGAILAASANLLDGWDFNGILVPALLALVVIEPTKFLATFVEALVIYGMAKALLGYTRVGRANIEGPRRIVLFFSLDYALRFVFAATVGRTLPGGDVVGLMGFGYLLPTLLAVKIAQKESSPLVLLPTAQVSVGAFALATLVGFSASVIDSPPPARAAVTRTLPKAPSDPEAAALWAGALARSTPHDGKAPPPLSGEELSKIVDRLSGMEDPTSADAHGLSAQKLDHGVLLLRESFQTLEDRWGDPVVLSTRAGRAAPHRLVLLVPSPTSEPEASALAGRLVAEGRVDTAVLAGLESGLASGGVYTTLARDQARALARRDPKSAGGDGKVDPGFVVALRRSKAGAGEVVLEGNASSPRLEALVSALEAKVGPLARRTGNAGDGVDATISLPEAAIAALFPSSTVPASLASPAAVAQALEGARAYGGTATPEDLLVLRRLVLEPILSTDASKTRSIAALRMAADKLGYVLQGPSPAAGGGEAFALVPGSEPRPVALFAKTIGGGIVVEVPHAFGDGLRDVALRVATSMKADAVLLGLEHGGAARGGSAMRMMHAVALEGRDLDRKVLVLRPSAPEDNSLGVVGIGAWGGPLRVAFASDVKKTFAAMGFTTAERPLDLPMRELGARGVFGDVPLVAVVVDPTAMRNASLDEARGTARVLSTSGFATMDGTLASSAKTLAASLPSGAQPAYDVMDLGKRVALEQSVVARRALSASVANGSARAALVRAPHGDFLLVVTHDGPKGLVASAMPIDPLLKLKPRETRAKSFAECASVLDDGGTCRAEMP